MKPFYIQHQPCLALRAVKDSLDIRQFAFYNSHPGELPEAHSLDELIEGPSS